jgi:hypothetical protein
MEHRSISYLVGADRVMSIEYESSDLLDQPHVDNQVVHGEMAQVLLQLEFHWAVRINGSWCYYDGATDCPANHCDAGRGNAQSDIEC